MLHWRSTGAKLKLGLRSYIKNRSAQSLSTFLGFHFQAGYIGHNYYVHLSSVHMSNLGGPWAFCIIVKVLMSQLKK